MSEWVVAIVAAYAATCGFIAGYRIRGKVQ